MNTEALEKCINSITDYRIIDAMDLSDFNRRLISPFYKELNINLVDKEQQQGKETLIRYYLEALSILDIEYISYIYNSIESEKRVLIFDGPFKVLFNSNLEYAVFETNGIKNYYLINEILKVVQKLCFNHNIDYIKLAAESNFPADCTEILKPNFKISDKDQEIIEEVFNYCNHKIFQCDISTFKREISNASFQLVNVINEPKVKDLAYRLTGIMGKQWRNEVCITMEWKKTDISGQGSKYKATRWMKDLEKILPRPLRDTKQ